MFTTRTIKSLIVAVALATLGVAALAAEAQARPPLGYQMMCLKTPAACKGGGAAKETLSSSEMATLKRINASVNRSIKPRHDRGGTDVWSVNATSGDCEDYALAKRAALIRAGFAPSALRLAYVKTRKGVGHAVLVVKSNKGDLVLDNLTGAIKPLSQSGLRLISIAGANPTKWS
jgi:predicted transglutaminase-like cysteine proteinase